MTGKPDDIAVAFIILDKQFGIFDFKAVSQLRSRNRNTLDYFSKSISEVAVEVIS